MFVYTVYPISNVSKSTPPATIRPADRVSAVEPLRAVQRTWSTSENSKLARQTQSPQTQSTHSGSGIREQMAATAGSAGLDTERSRPLYLRHMRSLIPLRSSQTSSTVDEDYIQKALSRLGNTKKTHSLSVR